MTGKTGKLPANLGNLLARPGLGDRTVLVDLRVADQPVEFTADGFDRCVRAFARGLQEAGIRPGQRVGFLSENRWEMLAGYLGAMYMGAVAVPINYKFPGETVGHIVKDAEVSLLFCDGPRQSMVPSGVSVIGFDDAEMDGFKATVDPGSPGMFEPGVDDLAEILYTSGSTGMPKGVPLNHAGQLWALSKYLEPIEEPGKASGASLIVAPLYHMNALVFSSACLINAVTIVLQPRWSAANYINAVARYRCTYLTGVPTMFAMVAALDAGSLPPDLTSVSKIMIGSAPLSDALLRQVSGLFPAATIANGYGTTEAGPAVFGTRPAGRPTPRISLGYPHADVQWRLTGGASANEGVLELKTAAVTRGYLNRPEADRERLRDGWFNTNDIMRRDDDGFFYFISRADDMFVCGGENIFPGEVEALLNKHPAVQDSLVVGAPDDIKGRVPVAFVVPVPGTAPDEDEIRAFCIDNGPAYAHPRRVVFKSILPVGGTYKIERRSLEREAADLMVSSGRATAKQN